ncbi:hypothetical protein [Alicyclobacillus sendaiensis]|uniref:hypothetical protein n=1 Tax=Alicyclobacillus sendaiensis TaxID=192387 RepID=UPI0026F468B6|nr:hypothetical protein [Alicyclobacillus sendaiensis]
MLADLSVTVLGVPTALLPALVSERFGGRPETLGLLMGATGVGGLVILALSGPVRHIRPKAKRFWSPVRPGPSLRRASGSPPSSGSAWPFWGSWAQRTPSSW